MSCSFEELGITPPILKALHEMGFEEPTEVQAKAIPHILNQKDIIVMSKTGSGKTAVFGVSMLQMIDPEKPGPQGLVLTPARELAVQVDSDIRQMSKHVLHKTVAVYGQHNMNTEVQALKNGISIVTGTPGRVYDHICQGTLDTKNIHFLVLDEADRMLDMGFIDQVGKIIKTLPKNRLTLLFSATIPPEIKRICSYHMKNPLTIEIKSETKTVDTTKQIYYRVKHNEKLTQLSLLLLSERPENCMIFCNTRVAVDRVQNSLSKKGFGCQALHGDIPQNTRLRTMNHFKNGDFHILVATDVAARGIHIDGLSLVINYDVPNEKDSYIHRIGRTGRAGQEGRAISLVTGDEIMSLYEIEEHIGALIEESELPTNEYLSEYKDEIEAWMESNIKEHSPAPVKSTAIIGHVSSRKKGGAHTQASGKRKSNDEPKKQPAKQRNTDYTRGSTSKQTVKPSQKSSANRRRTDNGYSTKGAGSPKIDYNTELTNDLTNRYNNNGSDSVCDNSTRQTAAVNSNIRKTNNSLPGNNQTAKNKNIMNGSNDKQMKRTGSNQSTDYKPKVAPPHPAIVRLRAEAAKNKTNNLSGQALASASDNRAKKQEQSFVKRLANRLFRK